MDRHITTGVHRTIDRCIDLGIHHAKSYDCGNVAAIHSTGGELPRRER